MQININSKHFLLLLLVICCYISGISAYSQHLSAEELAQEVDAKVIYYGSTIRLQHKPSQYHLHSHEVRYGSGSGQQSITAVKSENDYNSLWTIKCANGQPSKLYNEPVKCNDKVRFEHALTGKNLHSHDYTSQVSRKFEVSGFGDGGNGDGGDDWIIACSDQQPGSNLVGKTIFDLKHIVTGRFLYTEAHFAFNERNCGHNCPIMGQLEVSCDRYSNQNTKWKINSGFIYVIKQKEEEPCYGVDCPEKEGEFDEDELRKKDDDDDVEL